MPLTIKNTLTIYLHCKFLDFLFYKILAMDLIMLDYVDGYYIIILGGMPFCNVGVKR